MKDIFYEIEKDLLPDRLKQVKTDEWDTEKGIDEIDEWDTSWVKETDTGS